MSCISCHRCSSRNIDVGYIINHSRIEHSSMYLVFAPPSALAYSAVRVYGDACYKSCEGNRVSISSVNVKTSVQDFDSGKDWAAHKRTYSTRRLESFLHSCSAFKNLSTCRRDSSLIQLDASRLYLTRRFQMRGSLANGPIGQLGSGGSTSVTVG